MRIGVPKEIKPGERRIGLTPELVVNCVANISGAAPSLYDEFKQPSYAPPPLLKRMVATGRLGRKSGIGFYEYEAAAAAEGSAA